ncbi:MAG: hypothetical protein K2X01_00310 [Cyanobacteria bacterium]|nr:hypothetical protein [Cyanobacteriota bacterium]
MNHHCEHKDHNQDHQEHHGKNHRIMKLALGIALLSFGNSTKKFPSVIQAFSKWMGSGLIINGITGWNPLTLGRDKEKILQAISATISK